MVSRLPRLRQAMTRWHAAGRHLMATLAICNGAMGLHPLFFFIFMGHLIMAVFLTGVEEYNGKSHTPPA